MDSLWKEALREHHDSVVSAIRDEVIMQRLLDHLYSNKCIEDEHKELVRNEKTSRARANCLLDILKTQTEKVFHELCNALDNITIDAHQTLAQSLRQSLNKMQVKECQRIRVTSEGRLETHVRGKAVCALVVHNGELYVRLDLKDIQIYDAETLEYKRDLKVPELITVADMASCSYHNCIYIAESTSKRVHRVESEKSIEKWSVNDVPVGLSISSTHSVLVICCHPGMIKEFSTNGHLLSEIAILSDVNRPLHMSHAAELGAKRYVVCYGVEDGIVNTVCIVNCRGEIHHPCYGGDLVRPNAASPAAGFKRVAAANGFILVADCTRQRVVMLSPSLTFVRDDISSLKELDMMWYDRAARRLYVAGNSNEPGGSVVNVYQMHH